MRSIAVYPGSFDPPTFGHLDIVERAARMFDRVIVAVGINGQKQPFLPTDARIAALTAITRNLPNITIDSFDGLLVDYVRQQSASVIIRGLRATSDFDYEFQIAMANRRMASEIESVFLMTKWEHSYLSSSIVREIARLGGDFSQFVPPEVAAIVARSLAGSVENDPDAKMV
jgi:pantetheine-phosphate adenylyltransferase